MTKRTQAITARLVRRGAGEDAFDRNFWARVDPGEKLEILWDMVLEADVWKGGDGSEPRLLGSVCRLARR